MLRPRLLTDQSISCVPRTVLRYDSCVPGCWGHAEQLYCTTGSWVPWFDVRLRRCTVDQIKLQLTKIQIQRIPYYVTPHYIT